MEPNIRFDDSGIRVQLCGEIDHHTAKDIRETTDTLIQQRRPKELRLDFSRVSFMDSSGIGLIMGRYRMMSLYGGYLKVINVPEALEKIMILSGLGALNIIERRENNYDDSQRNVSEL